MESTGVCCSFSRPSDTFLEIGPRSVTHSMLILISDPHLNSFLPRFFSPSPSCWLSSLPLSPSLVY